MWKFYSLFSAFLIALINIFYKYLLKLKKNEYILYSCFIMVGVGICGLLYLFSTNQLKKYNTITLEKKLIAGLMSLLFFVGILLFYYGLPISDNISLNTGFFAGGKIAFVLLITYFVFNETLSLKQLFSLFLIISGIGILGFK